MMRKVIKYQLWDLVKVCLLYMLILAALMLLGMVGNDGFAAEDGTSIVASCGMTGAVFAMIMGMCMFKEHFWMCLQNGISRRQYYLASAGTMAVLSVLLAAGELFILRLLTAIGPDGIRIDNMGSSLYSGWFAGRGLLAALAVNLVFTTCMNLAGFAVGYFLAELFYRSGKICRILIAAGLPVVLFVGLPYWSMQYPRMAQALLEKVTWVMGLNQNIPNPAMGTAVMAATALVFLLAGYPVIRRAEV
ncbi:MAG TPA: hypothetical protein H9782_10200 [Candidatus Bariatricus faecipullorum]|nr:hypothetical protein [Candidatus Bariatricus faecipullorum]